MEEVVLNFKYTRKEFIKADQQYLLLSKIIGKVDLILFPVFFLCVIWYFFKSSFSVFSTIVLAVLVLVLFLASYLYFIFPELRFKQNRKFQEEMTLVFSQNQIHYQTPSINTDMKWDMYSAIWENDDFYYLICAKRVYTIIPKRVFKSDLEKQAFEDIAGSHFMEVKRYLKN